MTSFKNAYIPGDRGLTNKHKAEEYIFNIKTSDGEIYTIDTGKIFYSTAVEYSIKISQHGITLIDHNITYPPHSVEKISFFKKNHS